jgi:hypothetical protein
MAIEQRPYAGTWRLSSTKLVQHTPDCLVYINGDTSVPGCRKCNGRIDVQKYVTQVSAEGGTGPGAASGSVTLSVPVTETDNISRDAKFIFRVGLEVHIYMRGYFPVRGMYGDLAEPSLNAELLTRGEVNERNRIREEEEAKAAAKEAARQQQLGGRPATGFPKTVEEIRGEDFPRWMIEKWSGGRGFPDAAQYQQEFGKEASDRMVMTWGTAEVLERYWRQKYPDAAVYAVKSDGASTQYMVVYNVSGQDGGAQAVPTLQTYASFKLLQKEGRLPPGATGVYIDASSQGVKGTGPDQQGFATISPDEGTDIPVLPAGSPAGIYYDNRGAGGFHPDDPGYSQWLQVINNDGTIFSPEDGNSAALYLETNGLQSVNDYLNGEWANDDYLPPVGKEVPNWNQALGQKGWTEGETPAATAEPEEPPADLSDLAGSSLLQDRGLGESGLENVMAYPYYHVFHGVVTQVQHSWSAGVMNVSLSCASMLHFWEYHRMSTNASIFGANPVNSKAKVSFEGNNFTGMHPYEILYTLHYDMVGAAGGVGWALSQKSNLTAKTEITGESLFSLNVKYWQKRFSTRMVKLRMHGATGQLFSAAQAAYISRLNARTLTRLIRRRYANPTTKKSSGRRILSSSTALGLTNKQRRKMLVARGELDEEEAAGAQGAGYEDLVIAQKTRQTKTSGGKYDLNMAEMIAFVPDLGNYGDVQMFEASYESKLDIANKVCEVTGFEFYQDVDGDFVFKPPMYNMDTSSSRVYRIEDIDIISISFTETEPQVTYMTAKNAHFKNLHGTGLDNEWGLRGQYIDYRLVAQFGWRPGDWETSYFSDSKSMFFACVNRMDLLNAPSKKASVTIPIRPEIRPGYPVYIPYLDAFYYCTQLNHSYQTASSCTTSLELTAKRAKFFPPGDPSKNGIEAVDLKRTFLPPRPLQVLDNNGQPKMAGMPNVVMALDPREINPLFFVVGADLDDVSNPDTLASLVKMAIDMNIIQPKYHLPGDENAVVYTIGVVGGTKQDGEAKQDEMHFIFDRIDFQGSPPTDLYLKDPKGVPRLETGAKAYTKKLKKQGQYYAKRAEITATYKRSIEDTDSRINDIDTQLNGLSSRAEGLGSVEDKKKPAELVAIEKKIARLTKQKEKLEARIQRLETKSKEASAKVDTAKNQIEQELQKNPALGILIELIKLVGREHLAEHPEIQGLQSTHNYLDMLSDKKAIFSNGTQPGAYRYYSASHPDKGQQGQPVVEYYKGNSRRKTRTINLEKPSLDPAWRGHRVRGFVPTKQVISRFDDVPPPEAQVSDPRVKGQTGTEVVHGIRVLTNNPAKSARRGEVLPTSEIRELMFSVQFSELRRRRNSSKPQVRIRVAKSFRKQVRKAFREKGKAPKGTDSVESLMGPLWDEAWKVVVQGSEEARKGREEIPVLQPAPFPVQMKYNIDKVDSSMPLEEFNVKGGKGDEGLAQLRSPHHERWSFKTITYRAADQLTTQLRGELNKRVGEWYYTVLDLSDKAEAQLRFGVISAYIQNLFGGASTAKGNALESKLVKRTDFIYSPVFPVSDNAGYEVVGSYRYGRDVDIEPDGAFDVLHRQDPFAMLDKKTVEDIVDAIARRRAITVRSETVVKSPDGRTVKRVKRRKNKGSAALTDLERRVLSALQKNMSDQDIIDLGLATRNTKDPNLLEFDLRNWFSDGSREGIAKLPLINAAYSLADLTYLTSKPVCDCRAMEAGILLEGSGRQDFLRLSASDSDVGTETDNITQFAAAEAAVSAASWKQNQDALRGAVLDRAGSTLLESFQDAVSQFGNVEQRQQAAVSNLDFQAAQAQAAAEQIDEGGG